MQNKLNIPSPFSVTFSSSETPEIEEFPFLFTFSAFLVAFVVKQN